MLQNYKTKKEKKKKKKKGKKVQGGAAYIFFITHFSRTIQ